MQSKATTVSGYLESLPPERRAAINEVRAVILEHLPKGFEEGMLYGMIAYYVPLSTYPVGYHADPKMPVGPAGLASQKNYMTLYLMNVYADPATLKWFTAEWKKSGKKLDMGKTCIRFKKVEDLPLDVIGKAIARTPVKEVIAWNEAALKRKRAKA